MHTTTPGRSHAPTDGHNTLGRCDGFSGPPVPRSFTHTRHGRDSSAKVRLGPGDPPGLADSWARWLAQRCVLARDSLVNHYMAGHVRGIADRLCAALPGHIDVDDLVQQGYLGLIESLRRFDPSRRIRFETFSSQRIAGAMQDWLRAQDHVPRLMRKRSRIIDHQVERFRVLNGRAPDLEELRSGMDVEPEEFDRIVGEAQPPMLVTMGAVSAGGEDDPVALPDPKPCSPIAGLQRHDLQRWITRDLEPVDRMIVVLYYYESLTMREVGVTVGCSESRVSQRLDSILSRLRARIDLTPEGLEFVT